MSAPDAFEEFGFGPVEQGRTWQAPGGSTEIPDALRKKAVVPAAAPTPEPASSANGRGKRLSSSSPPAKITIPTSEPVREDVPVADTPSPIREASDNDGNVVLRRRPSKQYTSKRYDDDRAHRGLQSCYGDLREIREHIDSKFDAKEADSMIAWVEQTIGVPASGKKFLPALRDGVLLCKLMHRLDPASIDPSKIYQEGAVAALEMSNIGRFLEWMPGYGVRQENLFEVPDLYEATNLTLVLMSLNSLRRVAALKDQGVEVKPVRARRSVILKTERLSRDDVFAPRIEKQKRQGTQQWRYDHSGKDVVNAAPAEYAAQNLYGDQVDRQKAMQKKLQDAKPALDRIKAWISGVLDRPITSELLPALKGGSILCDLMNALAPGSITQKYSEETVPFKAMATIGLFLDALPGYGVRAQDMFRAPDLYEDLSPAAVLHTLQTLQKMHTAKSLGAVFVPQELTPSPLLKTGKERVVIGFED